MATVGDAGDERVRLSPFADWPESDALAVRSLGRLVVVEPGTVLLRAGGRESFLGIVVRGSFGVEMPVGPEYRRIGLVGPGEVFGEMSFLDSGPQVADIVALDSGSVIRIERADLDEFARRNPRIAVELVRSLGALLSRRLRGSPGTAAAPAPGAASPSPGRSTFPSGGIPPVPSTGYQRT
jgi:CRP/FNR family transcriptional regulator, cyclic AMP receptor protein